MTLRQRLTLTYTLVAFAGLLLASIAGAILIRTMQVRLAERTVHMVSAIVATHVDEDPATELQMGRNLRRLASVQGVRLLEVDREGTILRDSGGSLEGQQLPVAPASFAAREEGAGRPQVRRLRLNRESLFVSGLPVERRADGTRLLVAVPAITILDSWFLLLPGLLLLVALGAVVAGGASWHVSRKLAEPIEALTGAANKMAEGDYEARVEPPAEFAELQTLARSFNTMAEEVRRARQTQRDFLANVSHDLRTPLTSIQGFSQALMDGAVPEGQTGRVAGIIHTEAGRLSRLVQDLLDLARIEAGRFTMVQRDINLKTVLERCSEKFKLQADAMGVEFEAKIPRRALPVHGDADRLEQVVTNLIDNALTYAQDGGGHVKVVGLLGGIRGAKSAKAVKSQANGHGGLPNGTSDQPEQPEAGKETENEKPEGEKKEQDPTSKLGRWWIEIRIEDDGPGIANEQKALVFERFYRASNGRSGGTGLGLAIAREIVEAHGGDIFIDENKEQGTEFVVRLPMKMW